MGNEIARNDVTPDLTHVRRREKEIEEIGPVSYCQFLDLHNLAPVHWSVWNALALMKSPVTKHGKGGRKRRRSQPLKAGLFFVLPAVCLTGDLQAYALRPVTTTAGLNSSVVVGTGTASGPGLQVPPPLWTPFPLTLGIDLCVLLFSFCRRHRIHNTWTTARGSGTFKS